LLRAMADLPPTVEPGLDKTASSALSSNDPFGDLPAGVVVSGYRIEAKLGSGGFGSVYRAREPAIGRVVAVKVLSGTMANQPDVLARFLDEARAATKVRHRHIIDVFQFGQLPDGRPYQVMELLEGESLAQYLGRSGPLPVQHAVPLLRGIARAIDVIHDAGIVHRDIKPDNVFLTLDEDGLCLPKLLDFGIAKQTHGITERRTMTGAPIGTPAYMSPEQCRGDQVDARTDIYSFGALIFEVLTGKLPFEGRSFIDLMNAHLSAEPPNVSATNSGVPAGFDAAVLQCLAKAPQDRPPRASAVVDLLQAASTAAGLVVASDARPSIPVLRATQGGATPLQAPALPSSSRQTTVRVTPRLVLAMVASLVGGGGLLWWLGASWASRSAELPVTAAPVVIAPPTPLAGPEPIASPEPALPSVTRITVSTNAPKAALYRDGAWVAEAGKAFTVPQANEPIRLMLKAAGFADVEVEVSPSEDRALEVPMTRLKAKPTKKVPTQLENPYDH
jgi:eukaryotic-like serine/threonine-protein kinase